MTAVYILAIIGGAVVVIAVVAIAVWLMVALGLGELE